MPSHGADGHPVVSGRGDQLLGFLLSGAMVSGLKHARTRIVYGATQGESG